MEQKLPHTALTVRRVYVRDKNEISSEILEGEVPMSQPQQDYYKGVLGDEKARVSVGADLSDLDFGSGCKVFVSVSLTCDQSQGGIQAAANLARMAASYLIEQHLGEARLQAQKLQLLKPPADPNARPTY